MQNNMGRPVWAEVDLGAVGQNMKEIRRIVRSQAEIMAIVKANGYGHGAAEIARTVLKNGANRLGVATLGEALQLRDAGIDVPILVLGYIPREQVENAVKYRIAQTVYTIKMAEDISRAALNGKKQTPVHIKIDSGMGRIGFFPGNASILDIEKIYTLPGIFVEGIYTHFAVADYADKSFSLAQLARFNETVSMLEDRGIKIPIKHAANSAAVIDLPETHLDMVRPGIIIYGLYPSEEVDKKKITLHPAMSLKTKVSFVKTVAAGTSISYGRRFVAQKETVIASLPLGYADGYSRLLSNKGEVLIGGTRLKVAGTVCMDQLMVDASAFPGVRIDDEAVIFGRQGNECVPVEEVAARLNTINYEVVCMISERVPRIYINN